MNAMDHAYHSKIKADMKSFAQKANDYCAREKLPRSMRSIFEHQKSESQVVPSCFRLFLRGGYPREIFLNSKMFYEFWRKLPEDFKGDVATGEEINKMRAITLADNDLRSFVQKVLGKDYVNFGV